MLPTITIDVMTPVGDIRFTLDVLTSDTVDNVKAKIHAKVGISQEQQVLWWDEQKLDDGGRCIGDYGIKQGSLVWMEVEKPPSRT